MIKGLKYAVKIIEEEIEFARNVNPIMTLGMIQIKELLEREVKEIESNEE